MANKKSDGQLLSENIKFEVEIGQKNIEIDNLKDLLSEYEKRLKIYRALECKEQFLTQYLRYKMATDNCSAVEWDEKTEACKVYSREHEQFKAVIASLCKKSPDLKSPIEEGVLIVKNGDLRSASVKFLYDESLWPIPDEFVNVCQ